jgi:hypothetical protein
VCRNALFGCRGRLHLVMWIWHIKSLSEVSMTLNLWEPCHKKVDGVLLQCTPKSKSAIMRRKDVPKVEEECIVHLIALFFFDCVLLLCGRAPHCKGKRKPCAWLLVR